jgi:high-affinity Fe2+/Pb2+ permease
MLLKTMVLAISSYLQDAEGHRSSKRLAGFFMLLTALLLGVVLFFCSVFINVKDGETAVTVIELFLLSGVALIIGTFVERLAFKKAIGKK